MKFYVGDECGIIKEITVLLAHDEKKAKPLVKKSIFAHNQNNTKKPDETSENDPKNVLIREMGTVNKAMAIDKLAWCNIPFKSEREADKKLAWVARSHGVIELIDFISGEILFSYMAWEPASIQPDIKKSWIGLDSTESSLIACDNFSKVYRLDFDLDKGFSLAQARTRELYSPPKKIDAFRLNPLNPNIIATGGKCVELTLWELSNIFSDDNKPVSALFAARNVPHDKLDLQVPVWVTSIGFLSSSNKKSHRVVITTHYGQIRIYETIEKRRPVADYQVCSSPILSHELSSDEKQIVFSDNEGNLQVLSTDSGAVLGKYKGITGAVKQSLLTALVSSSSPQLLFSVALDRFLRIHHFQLESRALIRRIYLKQRPTVFLVDYSTLDDKLPKRVKESADTLWDTLDDISKAKKPKNDL